MRRLHGDRRGTAMTEFVITLPFFLILFAGILKLGKIIRATSQVHGEANLKTFEKLSRVQYTGMETLPNDFAGIGVNAGAHLQPSIAGAVSNDQIETHPPRVDNDVAAGALESFEKAEYMAMGSYGHLGESYVRTGPIAAAATLPGMGEARTQRPKNLFGRMRTRSILGPSLVKDSIVKPMNQGRAKCRTLVGRVGSELNRFLTATGSRPMLAAGMRYGTVTGSHEAYVDIAGTRLQIDTYYNARVPPHTFPDAPELQTILATALTRLGMQSCRRTPYQQVLGISGGLNTVLDGGNLPRNWRRYRVDVPDPYPENGGDDVGGEEGTSSEAPQNEVGFTPPYNYGGPNSGFVPGYH